MNKRIEKIGNKGLIIFLFYYTLFIQGLMSLLNFPQYLLYLKDIILIFTIALTILKKRVKFHNKLFLLVVGLFILAVFSSIRNSISITYILVGMRKFFRGILYMYVCSVYLNYEDYNKAVRNCFKIQYINCIIIFIQRVFFHIGQDHSNGIFGTGMMNNYNNIMCLLIVSFCTAEYAAGNLKLKKWINILMVNMIIVLLAELKVLFFMLPIAVLMIVREKIFTGRGLRISMIIIVGGTIAVVIFGTFYSQQLEVILSMGLLNYNRYGLATHALVHRLNWITYTLENIFKGNILSILSGIGFGVVSGLRSGGVNAFIELGYGSYGGSTVFLELGLIGLALITLFFSIIFLDSFKHIKSEENDNIIIQSFVRGFSLCMIVFLFFSNYIFDDSCFVVYFGLSSLYARNIIEHKRINNKVLA